MNTNTHTHKLGLPMGSRRRAGGRAGRVRGLAAGAAQLNEQMMTLKKNLTFRADDDNGDSVMTNGFVDTVDVFFTGDVEIVLQGPSPLLP